MCYDSRAPVFKKTVEGMCGFLVVLLDSCINWGWREKSVSKSGIFRGVGDCFVCLCLSKYRQTRGNIEVRH